MKTWHVKSHQAYIKGFTPLAYFTWMIRPEHCEDITLQNMSNFQLVL